MSATPNYVLAVGMACPVGLSWQAACAAMRAGISRRQELWYVDDEGEPVVGSALPTLGQGRSPDLRRQFLLIRALQDLASSVGTAALRDLPLIIALKQDSASRPEDVRSLAEELSSGLKIPLSGRGIAVVAGGSYGGLHAIALARDLLRAQKASACLVAAADSLIGARALLSLQEKRRLLTERNSDGVIPGEAAAALLISNRPTCPFAAIRGVGFGQEPAGLENDVPLRGNGIVAAARDALKDAGFEIQDIDFRVSDAAGESFSFKEQVLLVSRLLRQRKAGFPLWLSAETLGDTGAAAGLCGIVSAIAGFTRGYAPGPRAIVFAGNADGQRASVVLEAPSA